MQFRNVLSIGLFLCSVSQAGVTPVNLAGDEFTLPPLLHSLLGETGSIESRLNVSRFDKKRFQAKTGEWLEFGDAFELPRMLSVEILQRENLMWVAGGVFQGQIGEGQLVKDDLQYKLKIKRGWIRVFIKPDSDKPVLQIETDHGLISARDAEFWLSTRPDQMEVYVLKGEVKLDSMGLMLPRQNYAILEKGRTRPRMVSTDWEQVGVEVKISAAYTSLVKLANQAEVDWKSGKIARTYADYRKKGWRKSSRLDPLSK